MYHILVILADTHSKTCIFIPLTPFLSCSLAFKAEQTCFPSETEGRECEAEPFLNSIVMNNYQQRDVHWLLFELSPSAVASPYLARNLPERLLLIHLGD